MPTCEKELIKFYTYKKNLSDLIKQKAHISLIKRVKKEYIRKKTFLEQNGVVLTSLKSEINYLEFCVNRDTLQANEKRCQKCSHYCMRDNPKEYGCGLYENYLERILCSDFKKVSPLKKRIINTAFKRCFLCANMSNNLCLKRLNRLDPGCTEYSFKIGD